MPVNLNSEAYWAGYRYAVHGCPPSLSNPYSDTLRAVEFELGVEAGRQAIAEQDAWDSLRHETDDENALAI